MKLSRATQAMRQAWGSNYLWENKEPIQTKQKNAKLLGYLLEEGRTQSATVNEEHPTCISLVRFAVVCIQL